jgi:hypothetical protein
MPATVGTTNHDPRSDVQSISNMLASDTRHANHFIPAAPAGRNGNGTARHLQKFRKEFDACLVGAPFYGKRGQRDFQRIAHCARDAILPRPRMNLYREAEARAGFVDCEHKNALVILSEAKSVP